jgi:hypothetical protein
MDYTPAQHSTKQPETEAPVSLKRETSWGAIVGIIIVVLVLIIGTLYFWGKELEEASQLPPVDETVTGEDILNRPDASTEALKEQSDADDVASIDADLSATDFSNLDAELNNIDAELNR